MKEGPGGDRPALPWAKEGVLAAAAERVLNAPEDVDAFEALARAVARAACEKGRGKGRGSAWEAAMDMQAQMRRCEQRPEDFDNTAALWGYVGTKFALRAAMAYRAFVARGSPPSLAALLAKPDLCVAAMGGGPAAELLAVAAARAVLGTAAPCGLAVCEWVDAWRPMVDAVGRVVEAPVAYHHCDVTKPLDDAGHEEFRAAAGSFDMLIFSHVLLECSKHGDALALLRDVWLHCPRVTHVLVLDAGQARGKGRRDRPLAGSLRMVAELAEHALGGPDAVAVTRVEGRRQTDGVLLARLSSGSE